MVRADRDERRGVMTEEFFLALCAALGLAVTARLRGFLTTWPRHEGVPVWIWNPLATTQLGRRSTVDIGQGPGRWNDANPPYGVGIYADLQAGAEATAATIRNGYYPEVLATLMRGGVIDQRARLANEITTWGTIGFAALIRGGWDAPLIGGEPVTTPATEPTLATQASVEELNAALQKRFALIRIALDPDLPTVEAAAAKLGIT